MFTRAVTRKRTEWAFGLAELTATRAFKSPYPADRQDGSEANQDQELGDPNVAGSHAGTLIIPHGLPQTPREPIRTSSALLQPKVPSSISRPPKYEADVIYPYRTSLSANVFSVMFLDQASGEIQGSLPDRHEA
ncbi:hypothetical protein HO133_003413 [Letharia lupina]|uniref:Uncharacterized protein n=1 Tax=Letharia lupina TaxID=560253 RepID=A0A8H6F9U3_9LECA|nr:uncharacterized protein HO133_003413 [Letharia lupina]KAF6220281.1 hypothetical protein HO133_003413 [Letharia lupina]